MQNKWFSVLVAFSLVLGMAATASAITYDFELGSAPPAMTGGTTQTTGGYSSFGFGNYFQWSDVSAITLTLGSLETHTTLDLEFDLALIDSWDGLSPPFGPDYFNVTVDGGSVFQENFGSYSGSPFVSGSDLYNNPQWEDSAYHISLSGIAHSATTLTISWFANGAGWQGGMDESFAIDNIVLSVDNGSTPVPEPATMLLFGTGLAGLIGSRIRRKK